MGWRTRAAVAGAVGSAAVAAVWADPPWVRTAGLDVWNYPAAVSALNASDARRAALADWEDRLAARWAASDRVAEAVRAGRLSAADGEAALDREVAADTTWYLALSQNFRVNRGREPTGRREVIAWYLARKLDALVRRAGGTPPGEAGWGPESRPAVQPNEKGRRKQTPINN